MTDETYRDIQVRNALMEQQQGNDTKLMLEYSKINRIMPEAYAKVRSNYFTFVLGFKGRWSHLCDDELPELDMAIMGIKGEARKQSIQMKGEGVKEQTQLKGGGLFGWIKGGNNTNAGT